MIRPQHKDLSPAHKAVFWCCLGFIVSYAYVLYPEDQNFRDWFMLADYEINSRAHFYYMGERFRWIVVTYIIDYFALRWQTWAFWILEVLYFPDYFFFFNDTPYGMIKGVVMVGILIITAVSEWRHYFKS
jgi:hypothetical protein